MNERPKVGEEVWVSGLKPGSGFTKREAILIRCVVLKDDSVNPIGALLQHVPLRQDNGRTFQTSHDRLFYTPQELLKWMRSRPEGTYANLDELEHQYLCDVDSPSPDSGLDIPE